MESAPGNAPEPRITPLPRAEWGDDVRAALNDAFAPTIVERFLDTSPEAIPVPTAISTMMHHPTLTGPWLTFNNQLLWSSTIGDRLRELVVLRVAWRTRSDYEWVQHVQLSARYAITEVEVTAIAHYDTTHPWPPFERAALDATDQLLDDYVIDDATWAALAIELDDKQLMEFVFAIGAYTALAMLFKSIALPLEPGMTIPACGLPNA